MAQLTKNQGHAEDALPELQPQAMTRLVRMMLHSAFMVGSLLWAAAGLLLKRRSGSRSAPGPPGRNRA
jgi:hypothetical protein